VVTRSIVAFVMLLCCRCKMDALDRQILLQDVPGCYRLSPERGDVLFVGSDGRYIRKNKMQTTSDAGRWEIRVAGNITWVTLTDFMDPLTRTKMPFTLPMGYVKSRLVMWVDEDHSIFFGRADRASNEPLQCVP
jgi:hypothetical protein